MDERARCAGGAMIRAVAGLLLFVGAAAPVAAQQALPRPYRSGWWAEYGGGTGTVRMGCASCTDVRVAYGESGYIRVGKAVSPRALLGVEFFGLLGKSFRLASSDSALALENASLAPIVLWYPWKSGVFIKGGAGVAAGDFSIPTGLKNSAGGDSLQVVASGVGSGLTFGVGFDIPVFRWLSITANFGTYFTALGDVTVQGTRVDDAVATMYNANFAVTFR